MCSAPWTASWSKHFIPSWAEHKQINTNHKNKTKKTKRICWHQWRGRSLFNRERQKSAEICWTTDYLITNITSCPDWTWNVMAPLILAHFNLGWRILGMTLQETWTMIRYFRHLYHSSGLYVTILHPYQTELNPHVFVDIACYLKPLNRPVCVLSLSSRSQSAADNNEAILQPSWFGLFLWSNRVTTTRKHLLQEQAQIF